jgi:hypothetical protein
MAKKEKKISTQKSELKVGLDVSQNVAFISPEADILARVESLIPAKVMAEIQRIHTLSPQGKLYLGQMVTWQRHKSGLLDRSVKLIFP